MTILQKTTFILVSLFVSSLAWTDEEELQKRINVLEKEVHELKGKPTYPNVDLTGSTDNDKNLVERVRTLELENLDSSTGIPKWLSRFHLSGNADFTYFNGQDNSHSPDSRFAVDNARLFFDFDVSDNVSFYFEWDIVREFSLKNEAGQLYLRLDRIFEVDALNLKVGRVPIPFGQEYLRFHEQRFENPLISFSAPAPYNWDEGIEIFGSTFNNRFDYIFAVTDGDDEFNENSNEAIQLTAKISVHPTNWASIVLSALDTGTIGDDNSGKSALEFGGSHAYPFGFGTDVINYQDGAAIEDDTDNRFSLTAWEVDTILHPSDWGQIWLAYGQAGIRSKGSSKFDRDLLYWIAEGTLELGKLSRHLSRYYLAIRYSAIGTFDSGEGYMLAAMNDGKELGYNTKDVQVVSAGLGVRLHKNIKLKLEYSWYDFNLVKGVNAEIQRNAADRNLLGLGVSAQF